MPKPWDAVMKRLIGANPQHFASWMSKGAQVKEVLPQELTQTLYADGLLKVEQDGNRPGGTAAAVAVDERWDGPGSSGADDWTIDGC